MCFIPHCQKVLQVNIQPYPDSTQVLAVIFIGYCTEITICQVTGFNPTLLQYNVQFNVFLTDCTHTNMT